MNTDIRDLRTLIRLAREDGDGRIAIPLGAAERIADRLEHPVTFTFKEKPDPLPASPRRKEGA